jgi:hypothetical protein
VDVQMYELGGGQPVSILNYTHVSTGRRCVRQRENCASLRSYAGRYHRPNPYTPTS